MRRASRAGCMLLRRTIRRRGRCRPIRGFSACRRVQWGVWKYVRAIVRKVLVSLEEVGHRTPQDTAMMKYERDERAATSKDSANVERLPYVGRLRRMRRSQLPDDAVELAQFLVGKLLIRDHRAGRTSGRIVETEAYPVGDAAGHAYSGMMMANRSLFLAKGHAYVYFIYGSSYMCNVSAERKG